MEAAGSARLTVDVVKGLFPPRNAAISYICGLACGLLACGILGLGLVDLLVAGMPPSLEEEVSGGPGKDGCNPWVPRPPEGPPPGE